MQRALSLGARGETEWESLHGRHRLERRRGVSLVLSEHHEALREVQRRLRQVSPRLESVLPTGGIVAEIDRIAAQGPGADGGLPVVWVEGELETEAGRAAWDGALASLNLAREHLSRHGPVFVVLAGTEPLHERVIRGAPDLYSIVGAAISLDEAPSAIVASGGVLSWLHLSDLHVEGERWEQDRILKRLLHDLPGLLEQAQVHPDLVFVTGDLSWSGQRAQLDGVQIFLGELMSKLGLDPRERLFLVPGNHDVDRDAIGRLVRRDQAAVLACRDQELRDQVNDVLGDLDTLREYGARLEEWAAFTSRMLGPARGVSVDRPWRTDVRKIAGIDVGIASLCSAWMCGPDEDREGRIVVGERQVVEAMDEIQPCDLRIALLHHPVDWLHGGERRAVRELLLDRAHVVLHGHLHEPDAEGWIRAERSGVVAAAGAAYAGRRWPHGFAVGSLDPASVALKMRFFTYSARDAGFWHLDLGAQKRSKDGVIQLPLKLEGVRAGPERGSGTSSLVARIARASEGLYASGSFLGVPAPTSAGRNATILDIFQPLDLSEHDSGDATVALSVIEAELLGGAGARICVLGDPGSGKSTITRVLALKAARRDPPLAPLLLPLREWVREGGDQGILTWAASFLSRRLSLALDEASLRRLCDEGQALMLIDGFDEVAVADQRESVRDQVASLAIAFPKMSMLATSRFAGYDLAPLPSLIFKHFNINYFSDQQLDAFVVRWYDAMERDPVERQRRRADLQAAFVAEPRARALARNPLLATLVALVHQHEAKLPGERARLYELVVTMLLETWPERRGQRFTEIDEGRQRVALEKLALRMQERRVEHDAKRGVLSHSVTLARGTLERELAEILREEGAVDAANASRVARRWVDWLAAGTGVLVEQEPGVFAFLHLSVFEYLAGRGLWRRESPAGDHAVARFVVDHVTDPSWTECLLLMLGSEADRRGLHAEIVQLLLARLDDKTEGTLGYFGFRYMRFMLSMLREEVDVSQPLTEVMLKVTAASFVASGPLSMEDEAACLAEIMRFGKRSRDVVNQWLSLHIRTAMGDTFLAAVSMSWKSASIPLLDLLRAREDIDAVVPELLEIATNRLPGHPEWEDFADGIGELVFSRCTPSLWLDWLRASDGPSTLERALASLLIAPETGAASATAALLRRAAWIGETQAAPDDGPASGRLIWNAPCGQVTNELTTSCLGSGLKELDREQMLWPPRIWTSGQTNFVDYLMNQIFHVRLLSGVSKRALDEASTALRIHGVLGSHSSFGELDPQLARIRRAHAAISPALEYLELCLTVILFRGATRDRHEALAGTTWCVAPNRAHRRRPVEIAQPPPWISRDGRSDTATSPALLSFLLAAGELYAGLAPMSTESPTRIAESALLVALRLQNQWLFLFFEPLCALVRSRNNNTLPPAAHALLLTLGLAQFQTTWQWPWGDTWASWFATDTPPEDWRVAFAWHQCQAVGSEDPEEVERHLTLARAALDRNDWPELAEELRSRMLYPNTPAQRALSRTQRP